MVVPQNVAITAPRYEPTRITRLFKSPDLRGGILQAGDAAEASAESCAIASPVGTSATVATRPEDAVAAVTHPHETV